MTAGRSLSVVHVAAPGNIGGIESVVRLLATGQRRLGTPVQFVSLVRPGDNPPLHTQLAEADVPVARVDLVGRNYLRQRRDLAAILAGLRPEVVHTHGYHADVVAAGLGRRLRFPMVATVHGLVRGNLRNRMYQWLQCRAVRRYAAVVAVAKSLENRLLELGVPRARLHFIANAWDGRRQSLSRAEARRQLALPEDAFVIGWVGRLSPEKGGDVLLEALAGIPDPAVQVAFLGEGSERAPLETLAVRLGLAGRVRFAGMVPDASALFAGFDAFALSSRIEATPIVLFEAMAARVPIVASAVGGVPDVVSEAEAWLVPAQDPQRLGQALLEVRQHPSRAHERAVAARERLDRDYGLDPWLARYDGLYRQVTGMTAGELV